MKEKGWFVHDPLWDERVEIIKQYYNPDGKILDMGCGNGYVLDRLKGEKTALDFSDDELKACSMYKTIRHDLNMPLKTNVKYDTILYLDVLEHLINPEQAIQTAVEHLKSRGLFIVSVPYFGKLKELVAASLFWDTVFHYTEWHVRFFSVNTFKEILENNHFKIVKLYKLGRWWPLYMDMLAVCKLK